MNFSIVKALHAALTIFIMSIAFTSNTSDAHCFSAATLAAFHDENSLEAGQVAQNLPFTRESSVEVVPLVYYSRPVSRPNFA